MRPKPKLRGSAHRAAAPDFRGAAYMYLKIKKPTLLAWPFFYRLYLSVADLSLAALAIDHIVYVNAGESIHPITSLFILYA